MQKKVAQFKYRNQAKAIDDLKAKGLRYVRRKGISIVVNDIEVYDSISDEYYDVSDYVKKDCLTEKLSSDGRIAVHIDFSSGLVGTSDLPIVKTTERVYDYEQRLLKSLLDRFKSKIYYLTYNYYDREYIAYSRDNGVETFSSEDELINKYSGK